MKHANITVDEDVWEAIKYISKVNTGRQEVSKILRDCMLKYVLEEDNMKVLKGKKASIRDINKDKLYFRIKDKFM